ncbi:hypothetical protein H1P_7030003 [Hyella patelloides LEGE 07179]|uniref:Uncharacterized protein n=1 Tax=Hyella patelloides LEGE 07179 TaxID=945734 RepID=A0A563W3E4_9CYAN|nr:hypothetical protein H1P_7030003 [Hyella patelloides LEGE 07179]
MSNLSIFTFETQQVRFVGTEEKPEWQYRRSRRIHHGHVSAGTIESSAERRDHRGAYALPCR